MLTKDYRDVAAGTLIAATGIFTAWYTATHYATGTIQNMGPGMFPLGMGYILIVLGTLIALPALFRAGAMPEIRFRAPAAVLSGTAAFALTITTFGLIPAVVAITVVSSLAERKVRPFSLIVLSACLCLIAYLIFKVGLNLPIATVRWPF